MPLLGVSNRQGEAKSTDGRGRLQREPFAEIVKDQINTVCCLLHAPATQNRRLKIWSTLGNNPNNPVFKSDTAASSRCASGWELWEEEPTLRELKHHKDGVKKWDLWCSIDWWTRAASNCKDRRYLSGLVFGLCRGEAKRFFPLPKKMPRGQFDLPCRARSRPSSSPPGAAIPLPCSATKQRNES